MILEFYPPPSNERIVLSEEPRREDVVSALLDEEWDDITFLVLKVDEHNWLEVSGSLQSSDGLSARFMESGEERVSARPPESVDEAAALMISYLNRDGHWRTMIPWFGESS